ncbi:Guanine nucleotide exchange factor lte1 [Malassezia vespertilionis]|uniref:Lte1p n=1 Tax=Malassezia vespertilionis TaxID=2020962 RepID=A0A2N1JE06_9BASI|nr:Guanine nucleotide exchange factor lte1 [Malassezia vespertilionis]PKI84779.1 Lte1p [Malassezia vespertilionis]WFD05578.1 Guanine nucleotide exchange factor lte1 [Malassezia vespertilionis]
MRLGRFCATFGMFLRKTRSTDEVRARAQKSADGGLKGMGKRLKNKRSFRLFRSPRLDEPMPMHQQEAHSPPLTDLTAPPPMFPEPEHPESSSGYGAAHAPAGFGAEGANQASMQMDQMHLFGDSRAPLTAMRIPRQHLPVEEGGYVTQGTFAAQPVQPVQHAQVPYRATEQQSQMQFASGAQPEYRFDSQRAPLSTGDGHAMPVPELAQLHQAQDTEYVAGQRYDDDLLQAYDPDTSFQTSFTSASEHIPSTMPMSSSPQPPVFARHGDVHEWQDVRAGNVASVPMGAQMSPVMETKHRAAAGSLGAGTTRSYATPPVASAPLLASPNAVLAPPAAPPRSAPPSSTSNAPSVPLTQSAPIVPTPFAQHTSMPDSVVRVDSLLGAQFVLYDDPCVQSLKTPAPNAPHALPVAWTYDDWFAEFSAHGQGHDDDITAIVGCNNPSIVDPDAHASIMAFAAFGSTLRYEPSRSCMYDMASRVAREGTEVMSLAAADKTSSTVPITARARNLALLVPTRHVVLAATPHRLIAEMTSGSSPGLTEDILLCYRSYFNALHLFGLLRSRLVWAVHSLSNELKHKCAVHVLSSTLAAFTLWVEEYYAMDFAQHAELQRNLLHFVTEEAQAASAWQLDAAVDDAAGLRDAMHKLYLLVTGHQEPADTAASSRTPSLGHRKSPSLQKVKSFTRLFSGNKRAEDESGHKREPSGGWGHKRAPSSSGLRRKVRMDEATPAPDAPDEHRHFRRYEPPQDKEGCTDTDDVDQDANLSQLEKHLDGLGAGIDNAAQTRTRTQDGPVQWIPSHANASWKDAQRLSTLVHCPLGKTSAPGTWPARESLLLSQRSNTIAKQLSQVEKQLFAMVHWKELLELSWDQQTVQQELWQREYQEYVAWRISHAGTPDKLPATLDKVAVTHMLIARFNRTCAWVASHIVMTDEFSERVVILSKFIRIAWHCYLLGNMATVSQILFGLQSPWIARLLETWRQVGAWEMRIFQALRRLTSPHDQFLYLRQSMLRDLQMMHGGSVHMHIPFFGTFVMDLAANDALSCYVDASLVPNMMPFYDDQELSQSWDALLNLYRLRMKAMIVRDFKRLQRASLAMPDMDIDVPILAETLQLDTLSTTQIQNASLALE